MELPLTTVFTCHPTQVNTVSRCWRTLRGEGHIIVRLVGA